MELEIDSSTKRSVEAFDAAVCAIMAITYRHALRSNSLQKTFWVYCLFPPFTASVISYIYVVNPFS